MPKLNIRARKRGLELRARKVRRLRLMNDAKQAIELVKATGVGDRQGVVMLVFDLAEGDVTGYVNVDPVLAALALIEYLEQKDPRAKRG